MTPPNSDYTDHPSVYQSRLISFTSLLVQGVSNEKQRRVNLAITEKRGIAAIRELCRTRHASRQAFSLELTQRRQEAKTKRAGRWSGEAGGEELTQRRRGRGETQRKGNEGALLLCVPPRPLRLCVEFTALPRLIVPFLGGGVRGGVLVWVWGGRDGGAMGETAVGLYWCTPISSQAAKN